MLKHLLALLETVGNDQAIGGKMLFFIVIKAAKQIWERSLTNSRARETIFFYSNHSIRGTERKIDLLSQHDLFILFLFFGDKSPNCKGFSLF